MNKIAIKLISKVREFVEMKKGDMHILYPHESRPYIEQARKLKLQVKKKRGDLIKYFDVLIKNYGFVFHDTPESIYQNINKTLDEQINNLIDRTTI